ncbi:hypothetical protein GTY65_24370 [Streptomyces sp. SID8379]|uniref:hypothetical protein n=1 Tax=unclassified Streptomyces TaxID=2593676 RepID=UPI0003A05B17|nr:MULTISPECIES: hypothetical protein [unclassified Streptomyces]MYW67178.1 hypothetical protein [Streptomyces sp. SID8379]
MPGKPVYPTNVYPYPYEQLAQHLPVEQYQAGLPASCQCGHGHGPAVQQIIVKQPDRWGRYLAIGFAAASITVMLLVGLVVTLIAAGACALCVAFAARMLRGLVGGKKK